jgi:di/tricarboxylate transporter
MPTPLLMLAGVPGGDFHDRGDLEHGQHHPADAGILAAAALAAGLAPELIMVPAAISASCAFMLPVATAPNTVVFGSGMISTARMAREGLLLNFVAAAVVAGVCYGVMVP